MTLIKTYPMTKVTYFMEYVIKKLIDSAVSIAKDIISNRIKEKNEQLLKQKQKKNERKKIGRYEIKEMVLEDSEKATGELIVSSSETYDSLKEHLKFVKLWSTKIGFSDLRGSKKINDIYVELDTYLSPIRSHIDPIERKQIKPLKEAIFSTNSHCVVLGQPGAGKTTSMKKLCSIYFADETEEEQYCIPLVIRFRDMTESSSGDHLIMKRIADFFPIQFQFGGALSSESAHEDKEKIKYQALTGFIDSLKPIVILDGFDEFPNPNLKPNIISEIRRLSTSFTNTKFIITCRSGEFNYNVDNTETFEIAPLSRDQIKLFANRWIGNSEEANKFLKSIAESPFSDTTIKPLSLAHLCAIYERIGKIPDRPKTVYKKIVNLLLEEWDEQRSVKRISNYARFEPDRKFEFLSHLAFYFTVNTRSTVFSKANFIEAYKSICKNFSLEMSQSNLVATELESHTGLFLQSGYDQYEFVHKSLQEYLTAEYLVKLPALPKDEVTLKHLGTELAVAVSISSNPSLYISELGLNVLSKVNLLSSFYDAFLSRILQEKPDFYHLPEVVLSLFAIVTLWLNKGKGGIHFAQVGSFPPIIFL